VLQDSLSSYRLAVERPLHRALYDVAIPGVLRAYDLDHIAAALAPMPVTILNPLDARGLPMRLEELRDSYGKAANVRLAHRGRRDSLAGFLRTR
jgi:hypothetical protein